MTADRVRFRLNELLVHSSLALLDDAAGERFEKYLSLFLRWNGRLNLSAIRDEEGILSRHFVECIAAARALPSGISTLLDFGSGAGLPGIPIALCRPEISVTLAESQGKKAAFLQEAVRVLGLTNTSVYVGRAEYTAMRYECITLRAVDRMRHAVGAASRLLEASGWLALMTSCSALADLKAAAGAEFSWPLVLALPGSEARLLALGRKNVCPPVSAA
jgi:16S rRNA (guanine527-N7)-methyltransferase